VLNAENSSEAEEGIQSVGCTVERVRNFVISSAFNDACKDGLTFKDVVEENVFAESVKGVSKFTSLAFNCRG